MQRLYVLKTNNLDRFNNKYRIPSARAQWWDYGWNGSYFITICTWEKERYFGEVLNGKMILSKTGIIADILWHQIPRYAKHVELGKYVVMPNHMHGILILNKPDFTNKQDNDLDNSQVETLHATSLRPENQQDTKELEELKNEFMSSISPKSNSVGAIIRSYKSAVTKHANRLGLEHAWQPRYHDHIIRNEDEFHRISNYIKINPENWKKDRFYTV